MSVTFDRTERKKRGPGRPAVGRKSVAFKFFPETIRALAEAAAAEGCDKSTFIERAILARIGAK